MILIDLFCGRWGWSRAFAKHGWRCIGVDLTKPPEIPKGCEFFQCDVLDMNADLGEVFAPVWCQVEPDAIVASPPCEEFSVHGMKHFHPHPKYPANGIRLFEHTRTLCEASGLPYVIENVRSAQQFVGNAKHHCGPFYLWGNAVPPLVNQGIWKGAYRVNAPSERKPEFFKIRDKLTAKWGSKQKSTAELATIPPELANSVAEFMERILELKNQRRA